MALLVVLFLVGFLSRSVFPQTTTKPPARNCAVCDGVGELDRDGAANQFLSRIVKMTDKTPEELLNGFKEKTFEWLDSNDDGSITADEVKAHFDKEIMAGTDILDFLEKTICIIENGVTPTEMWKMIAGDDGVLTEAEADNWVQALADPDHANHQQARDQFKTLFSIPFFYLGQFQKNVGCWKPATVSLMINFLKKRHAAMNSSGNSDQSS